MNRRSIRALLAMALAMAAVALAPVAAETTYTAAITSIDTSAFPDIRALVAVSDSNGLRIPGLNKSTFTLLENGAPVTITEINEEAIGLQLAIVVDSSTTFAKRDATTITRLDYVKTSLVNFAVGDGGSIAPYMEDVVDTVSIFAPEGPIIQNSAVGGEIRNALIAYQSKFQAETNGPSQIAQAVDAVLATPPRPGMRREIVIFTAGIDSIADDAVAALAERAKAEDITFHTVLVGPPAIVNLPLADNVKALAALSGGSFRYFDGPVAMNPLWGILITQRIQYRVAYRSALAQSGQYTLQALANLNGTSILSTAENLSIAVEPPTAAIVDPPAEIVRATEDRGVDPASIEPRTHLFSVDIGFPDGHPRNLSKVQLIVDNTIAAETTVGPFDSLSWDLTGYGETGMHSVQVIAFDELGLAARSDTVNVLVTVNVPPPLFTTVWPMLFSAAGVISIGVAVAILVAAILIFLRRPTVVTNIVREASARVKEATEPFIPTPHRGAAKQRQGKAYLERIDDTSPGPHPTIELIGDNLRLGRDETLAQIAIGDRSVSRLHCRITEEADGQFFIHDEGSTSGTWVNYQQVSLSGRQLRHRDVINLGRVQFRFSLRFKEAQPPSTPAALPPPPAAPLKEKPAHSTEPFESVVQTVRATDESTEQGLSPDKTKPNLQPIGDEYHTEAFTPAFDGNSQPNQSDE